MPYTDEVQTRHFGTVESTLRMVDAHTSKLVGAEKIRLSERIRDAADTAVAVSDLLDLYSSELVHRISENLKARRAGEDTRPTRAVLDAERPKPVRPAVRQPNF